MTSSDLNSRIRKIQLVAFDVDGVLTDGSIFLAGTGAEIKKFNVYDGTGIVYLERAGIRAAILSGRSAPATARRAKELGIRYVLQGWKYKADGLKKLVRQSGTKEENICFVGDDLPDIPVMRLVGLAVAVKNACQDVLREAQWVTGARGGCGVAREVAERILRVQGKWADIIARYGLSEGNRGARKKV